MHESSSCPEYKKQYDEAEKFAEDTLALVAGDRPAEFLVQECIGRQWFYRGDSVKALPILDGAMRSLGEDVLGGLNAILTHNVAANAASGLDPLAAVCYSERAVAVARVIVPKHLEFVRAVGDLVIARERTGDVAGVYEALSEGASVLLEHPRDDKAWRSAAALYGHVVGYVSSIGTTARPPTLANDKEYSRPAPGTFYRGAGGGGETPRPQTVPVLCLGLALLANAVKRDEDAIAWAERVCEEVDLDPAREAAPFVMFVLPFLAKAACTRGLEVLREALVVTAQSTRESSQTTPDALPFLLGLIPFAAEILNQSTGGEGDGLCTAAARLCTEIAGLLPESGEWLLAASAFSAAVTLELSTKDYFQLAQRLPESLWVVAGILFALNEARPLERVIYAHLAVANFVLPHASRPNIAAVVSAALGAMEHFWRRIAATSTFRFAHPAVLLQDLRAAEESSTVRRALRVLVAVAVDLRVTVPPALRTE